MNIRLIVPALAAVGLGVWGVNKWSYGRTHESTDNAQVEGHIVPIVTKVGGYVLSVNAGENAAIAANAELVKIDDREYAVRLAQADADLAAARAGAASRTRCGGTPTSAA